MAPKLQIKAIHMSMNVSTSIQRLCKLLLKQLKVNDPNSTKCSLEITKLQGSWTCDDIYAQLPIETEDIIAQKQNISYALSVKLRMK